MLSYQKNISARLKSLAKRVERLEPNSLSGIQILALLDQWLRYAESIALPKGRAGAPKRWTASREDDLLRLVEEAKRRYRIETDEDVFIFMLQRFGMNRYNAMRSSKKYKNRLGIARNRSQ